MTYSKTRKSEYKNSFKEKQESNNISFQGIKGGVKGGAVGAAAALALTAIAGPLGLAVLPLWSTVGAIGGHANEEENKPANNNGK